MVRLVAVDIDGDDDARLLGCRLEHRPHLGGLFKVVGGADNRLARGLNKSVELTGEVPVLASLPGIVHTGVRSREPDLAPRIAHRTLAALTPSACPSPAAASGSLASSRRAALTAASALIVCCPAWNWTASASASLAVRNSPSAFP